MEDIAKLGIEVKSDSIVTADNRLDKLERQSKNSERTNKKLSTSFGGLRTAIAALGLGVATRAIIKQVDAYQSMSNKLRLVTDGTADLTKVQKDLFDIAQSTRGSLEATADLYFRLAKSTDALGISQSRLADVTETINKAVAVSGTTAQAASAALFQMGQGLASNALRGQELNSVLEQTPRVAQAIADGLGVDIGQLRKLAEEGKLTAETVVGAFESQSAVIDREFQGTVKTVSQAFQQLENVALQTFGSIDSSELVSALDELRKTLSDPAVVAGLQNLASGAILAAASAAKVASATGNQITMQAEWLAAYTTGQISFFEWITTGADTASQRLDELKTKTARIISSASQGALPDLSVAPSISTGFGAGLGGGQQTESTKAIDAEAEKNARLMEMGVAFRESDDEARRTATETRLLTEAEQEKTNLALITLYKQKAADDAKQIEDNANKQKLQATASTLGYLATLTSSSSKRLFELGKKASIAAALINTYQAITRTMAETPYPWNIPLAAAQGVAGAVQVQNIASQQFTPRENGGPVIAGQSYIVGEKRPEIFVPTESGTIIPDVNGAGNTLNVTVMANDADSFNAQLNRSANQIWNVLLDKMNEEGARFA